MSAGNEYNKNWINFWGSKRKSSHIHHIVPQSEGGSHEIGNIIELHPDDHALIHKMRGDRKFGEGFVQNCDWNRGLTKETHTGIARQAAKMCGRTKDNDKGIAQMAAKQKGKTKANNPGTLAQSIKMTKHSEKRVWRNKTTGKTKVCTANELLEFLMKTLGIARSGGAAKVIQGKRKSFHKWSLQ